eukprot:tig00000448_g872.t1
MTGRTRPPGGEKTNLSRSGSRGSTPPAPKVLHHASSASHIGPGLVPQAGADFHGGKRGFKEDGAMTANVDHIVFDGAAFPGRHMPNRNEGVRPLVKVDPKDAEVKRYLELLRAQARQHGLQFRTQFLKYDANRDGVVSAEELAKVLEFFHAKVSGEVLGRILRHVDADGSGSIDYMEFLASLTDAAGGNYSAPRSRCPPTCGTTSPTPCAPPPPALAPPSQGALTSARPSRPRSTASAPSRSPRAPSLAEPRGGGVGDGGDWAAADGPRRHRHDPRHEEEARGGGPAGARVQRATVARLHALPRGLLPPGPPRAADPAPAPPALPLRAAGPLVCSPSAAPSSAASMPAAAPPRPPSPSQGRPASSPEPALPHAPRGAHLPESPSASWGASLRSPSPAQSYVPLLRGKQRPLSEPARRLLRTLHSKVAQEGGRLRKALGRLDERSEGLVSAAGVREALRELYYMDVPLATAEELAARFPAPDGGGRLDYAAMLRALSKSEGSLALAGGKAGPRAPPTAGNAFNMGHGAHGAFKRRALLADPALTPEARRLLEAMRTYVQQKAARNRMGKVFISLDGDGDGFLTEEEFSAGLSRMGIAAARPAVHEVLAALDEGGEEGGGPFINYAEFMRYMDEHATGAFLLDAQATAGTPQPARAPPRPPAASPPPCAPAPRPRPRPRGLTRRGRGQVGGAVAGGGRGGAGREAAEQSRAISAAILDFNLTHVAPERVNERPRGHARPPPTPPAPTALEIARPKLLRKSAFAEMRQAFRGAAGSAQTEGGQGAVTREELKRALLALPSGPLTEAEAEAVVAGCAAQGRGSPAGLIAYDEFVNVIRTADGSACPRAPAPRPRPRGAARVTGGAGSTPDGSLPLEAWRPAPGAEGGAGRPRTPPSRGGPAAPSRAECSLNVAPLLRPAALRAAGQAGSPGFMSESERFSSAYAEQSLHVPTAGTQERDAKEAVARSRVLRRAATEERIQAYVDGVREREREDLVKKYLTKAAPGRTKEHIREMLFGSPTPGAPAASFSPILG